MRGLGCRRLRALDIEIEPALQVQRTKAASLAWRQHWTTVSMRGVPKAREKRLSSGLPKLIKSNGDWFHTVEYPVNVTANVQGCNFQTRGKKLRVWSLWSLGARAWLPLHLRWLDS